MSELQETAAQQPSPQDPSEADAMRDWLGEMKRIQRQAEAVAPDEIAADVKLTTAAYVEETTADERAQRAAAGKRVREFTSRECG